MCDGGLLLIRGGSGHIPPSSLVGAIYPANCMTVSKVRWDWDPNKAASNLRRHRVPFELAVIALQADASHLSKLDTDSGEIRFKTLAAIESQILMIVHTEPALERFSGEWVGRIISARKAEPAERRAYRNG